MTYFFMLDANWLTKTVLDRQDSWVELPNEFLRKVQDIKEKDTGFIASISMMSRFPRIIWKTRM